MCLENCIWGFANSITFGTFAEPKTQPGPPIHNESPPPKWIHGFVAPSVSFPYLHNREPCSDCSKWGATKEWRMKEDEMYTCIHQIMDNMVKSLQFKILKNCFSKRITMSPGLLSSSQNLLILPPSAASANLTNMACFTPRVRLSHFILLSILFSSCGRIRMPVRESNINQLRLVVSKDAEEK